MAGSCETTGKFPRHPWLNLPISPWELGFSLSLLPSSSSLLRSFKEQRVCNVRQRNSEPRSSLHLLRQRKRSNPMHSLSPDPATVLPHENPAIKGWNEHCPIYTAMMKFYKMIKDSREKEAQIKQEDGTIDYNKHQMSKRLCASLPNQRMARLSQADHFGGKDRHSKVSTIKGLRDRRVRLSIPTAIQVYDLQDKLGLNQPSKVVDWLISAAQNEIDKLPSEQLFPSGSSFIHFPQTDASISNEQNLSSNSVRAQAFGINTDPLMLMSNNYVDDITSFPKSTLNSFNSYHQMEPNLSHVGLNSSQVLLSNDFHFSSVSSSLSSVSSSSLALMPAETPLTMPSLLSSYFASSNDFQTPSTFAELLPWSSSSFNFKQYIHQDEAVQQLENMRGTNTTVYKDSGAGYGCNAADFF